MSLRRQPWTLLVLLTLFAAGCLGGSSRAPQGQTPVASFTLQPGANASTFAFDASASQDPDGGELVYGWNFGDGSPVEHGARVEHTYAASHGSFPVALIVRDPEGLAALASNAATLGSGTNKKPEVALDLANRWLSPGTPLRLDASPTKDSDEDPVAFEWLVGPHVPAAEEAHAPHNACAESSTVAFVFSTGCLAPSQSFSVTFSQPGTFDYHCHPHPWMKARIVVTPDATDATQVPAEIRDFGYEPREVRVRPGSAVVWTNRDPVAHTATVEYFTPGPPHATTATLNVTLEPGDYVARVVARDGSGSLASRTWGVRVSNDAPPSPNTTTFLDDVPLLPGQPIRFSYPLVHPAFVNGTFTWAEPVDTDQIAATLLIQDFSVLEEWVPAVGCIAATDPTRFNALTFACNMRAGEHRFELEAASGALAQWSLHVEGRPFAAPGFGDSTVDPHADH